MKNIHIDIKNGIVSVENFKINFTHKFGRLIRQVQIFNEFIFLLGFQEIADKTSPNYKDFDYNNVFAFSENGDLLWQKGELEIEFPINSGKIQRYPPTYIGVDNDTIYLTYNIGYEVWLNPKTGKTIKGKFENRRF